MGFIATESTLGVYAVAVNASEVLLYLPSTTALALSLAVSRSDPGARIELVLRGFRLAALITLAGMIVALLRADAAARRIRRGFRRIGYTRLLFRCRAPWASSP